MRLALKTVMRFDGDFVDKTILYTRVILLCVLKYGYVSNKKAKKNFP
jgi:hypothetical protein